MSGTSLFPFLPPRPSPGLGAVLFSTLVSCIQQSALLFPGGSLAVGRSDVHRFGSSTVGRCASERLGSTPPTSRHPQAADANAPLLGMDRCIPACMWGGPLYSCVCAGGPGVPQIHTCINPCPPPRPRPADFRNQNLGADTVIVCACVRACVRVCYYCGWGWVGGMLVGVSNSTNKGFLPR